MTQALQIPPWDEHNRKLVSCVHPADWVNPLPGERYNLVVVGAGTAGLVSAVVAAGLGARVALVERHLMGGDCLNVGCVPSKSLIRAARAFGAVREAGRFGVRVPEGSRVDFPEVMRRMRSIRSRIAPHDSAQRYADELGVDVYLGEARFTGPDRLEVAGAELSFARAIVATGARAAPPPIEGLGEAGYLTNETLFELTELPRRLAVIGAGPIGCEMAQTFRRFGSEVCLFEATDHILPREDADAARIVQQAFERDGVDLVLGASVRRVERAGDSARLFFEREGRSERREVDRILVGVGRAPNVEGLGLEAAGVEYDARSGVQVDGYLRTSNKRIYAAGDICLGFKFTHTADAAAKIAVQNALFFRSRKLSDLVVPWCTYTEPEIAHVGMYERDAEKAGLKLDTYTVPLARNDRSLTEGDEEGFVRVHTRKGSDSILGATIVAGHAGEMISELTLAIAGKIGLGRLSGVIHPYPTQSEAIKATTGDYMRGRLTPGLARLFGLWMRLRR
ncbi:MAG: mercuric reductase [Proteobacteria bacterium]|nr:mercuric reductase [Pseudomonadota bacterium]